MAKEQYVAAKKKTENEKIAALKSAGEHAANEMRDVLYKRDFTGDKANDLAYLSTRTALTLQAKLLKPNSQKAKTAEGTISYVDKHWDDITNKNPKLVDSYRKLFDAEKSGLPPEKVEALRQGISKLTIGIINNAEANYKKEQKAKKG